MDRSRQSVHCGAASCGFGTRTVLLAAVMALAGRAPGASTRPSTGPLASLGNIIQFQSPPSPWRFANLADGGSAAFYRWLEGGATMLVSAVAGKAPKNAQAALMQQADIIERLRGSFKSKGIKMIVEPRLEPDDRFFAVAYEKWPRSPQITASQWHIYRNLPPHQIVVVVLVNSDDQKILAEARRTAEQVALSAELIPRGVRPPPPPQPAVRDDRPRPDAAQARAEVAAAQAALDEASARCMAKLAESPAYQAALKKADLLRAEYDRVRRDSPDDQRAITDAANRWLAARGEAETMRRQALDADEAVVEARRLLNEARERLKAASDQP